MMAHVSPYIYMHINATPDSGYSHEVILIATLFPGYCLGGQLMACLTMYVL